MEFVPHLGMLCCQFRVHSNQGFSLPRSLDPKLRAEIDWIERATEEDGYKQATGDDLAPFRIRLAGHDATNLQPQQLGVAAGGGCEVMMQVVGGESGSLL
jgi:hypothetical protein